MRLIFRQIAAEYQYQRKRACPMWYAFPVFVISILAGAGLCVLILLGKWLCLGAVVAFAGSVFSFGMAMHSQRQRRARAMLQRLAELMPAKRCLPNCTYIAHDPRCSNYPQEVEL